jgi:hypothetical protein
MATKNHFLPFKRLPVFGPPLIHVVTLVLKASDNNHYGYSLLANVFEEYAIIFSCGPGNLRALA